MHTNQKLIKFAEKLAIQNMKRADELNTFTGPLGGSQATLNNAVPQTSLDATPTGQGTLNAMPDVTSHISPASFGAAFGSGALGATGAQGSPIGPGSMPTGNPVTSGMPG